jgi:g-D-glutamyl-meso-diaminopimelate peptidase
MMLKIFTLIWTFFFFVQVANANGYQDVVQTNDIYTYTDLKEDIKELERRFPETIETRVIGHSSYNNPLWAVKVGNGEQAVLINSSHHGREWITSMLVMKMIEDYARAHKMQEHYEGYSMSILDKVSIWFVPMVNPDGVMIQQNGLLQMDDNRDLLFLNGGSIDFSRWKANGNGIDLNRQYPAGWDDLNGDAPFPFYQLYKGESPLSAPEVKALEQFTREIDPTISVSYHSSGRVVYWYYKTKIENVMRDWNIAKHVAELTGYKLDTPVQTAVGGGYTDWFIHTFQRPALTVEVGYEVNETNPPLSVFPEEWKRNRAVGLLIAKEALKMGK